MKRTKNSVEFDRKIEAKRRENQLNATNSEEAMRQRMKEVSESAEIERRENQKREQLQRDQMIEEQEQAERDLEEIKANAAKANDERHRQEQKKLDEFMGTKNEEFEEIKRNEKRGH